MARARHQPTQIGSQRRGRCGGDGYGGRGCHVVNDSSVRRRSEDRRSPTLLLRPWRPDHTILPGLLRLHSSGGATTSRCCSRVAGIAQASCSSARAAVAAGLAELGIGPGERVVVTMANSPDVGVALPGAVARRARWSRPRRFCCRPRICDTWSPTPKRPRWSRRPEFVDKVSEAVSGLECVRNVICSGDVDGDVLRWPRSSRPTRRRSSTAPTATWRRCCTQAARPAAPRA